MSNRILKESICFSPEIGELNWFEEVVFYHLLVVSDDFGHMDGRNVVLARTMFPAREDVSTEQIGQAIAKLIEVGLVERYEVDGRPYISIVTWRKHQKLRRYKQRYPFPEGYVLSVPLSSTSLLEGELPSGNLTADCDNLTAKRRQTPANAGGMQQNADKRRQTPADGNKPPADCGGMQQGDGALLQDDRALSQLDGALSQNDGLNSNSNSKSLLLLYTPQTDDNDDDDSPFGYDTGKRPSFNTVESYAASNLRKMSPGNYEELAQFKTEVSEDVIRHAIDRTCANGVGAWSYTKTILQNYIEQGVKTVGDAKAVDDDYQRRKKSRASPDSEPEVRQDDWT